MERYFYIGDGDHNDKLVQRVEENMERCRSARKQLARDFGACKVWEQGGRVCGLAYRRHMDNRSWLRLVFSSGKYLVYCGNIITEKGNELVQRLRNERILHFNPEIFILDVLQAHRTVATEEGPISSWAFCADGRIAVSVPGSKRPIPNAPLFPRLPYWLEEVSEAQWTALKRERLFI